MLRLSFPMPVAPENPPPTEAELVDAAIERAGGDARAAIAALVADAAFLRDQLRTASCLMSSGMGRGWKPKYERGDRGNRA